MVAECGVLLGSVNATKTNGDRRYAGTDLGFNVLVRPAMYDSFHDVEVYRQGAQGPDTETVEQSVVGNICESGDILAKNRQLPLLHEGDVLGVLDAGAYGFVMSSSYNQRASDPPPRDPGRSGRLLRGPAVILGRLPDFHEGGRGLFQRESALFPLRALRPATIAPPFSLQ